MPYHRIQMQCLPEDQAWVNLQNHHTAHLFENTKKIQLFALLRTLKMDLGPKHRWASKWAHCSCVLLQRVALKHEVRCIQLPLGLESDELEGEILGWTPAEVQGIHPQRFVHIEGWVVRYDDALGRFPLELWPRQAKFGGRWRRVYAVALYRLSSRLIFLVHRHHSLPRRHTGRGDIV